MSYKFHFSTIPGSRSINHHLWFVNQDGAICEFKGVSILKAVKIISAQFTKCGKWSGTDYVLECPDYIRAVRAEMPWEGYPTTWAAMLAEYPNPVGDYGISDLEREKIVRASAEQYPRMAQAVADCDENLNSTTPAVWQ
jgi:hypothetical protein